MTTTVTPSGDDDRAIDPCRSFSGFAKKLAIHLATHTSSRDDNQQAVSKNYVCAPYGVNQILALLSRGATKATLDAFRRVLHLQPADVSDDDEFRNLYQEINLRHVENGEPYGLHAAARLWIKGTQDLKPAFENDAREIFFTKIEHSNDDLTGLEPDINSWVKEKTKGMIPSLLEPNTLNPLTALVAVHVMYLKAEWKTKFKLMSSDEGQAPKFHVHVNGAVEAEAGGVTTPMMEVKGSFKFAQLESGAKVVSIPFKLPAVYTGDKGGMILDKKGFNMLFYLPPDAGSAMRTMEHLPTMEQRQSWIDEGRLRDQKVHIILPKFKILTTVQGLKEVLRDDFDLPVFEGQAPDFENIFQGVGAGGELYVSELIQKAAIEVDEQGAEAAAATGAVVMFRHAMVPPPPPLVVQFDRPFGFQIIDEELNLELFRGYVEDPRK